MSASGGGARSDGQTADAGELGGEDLLLLVGGDNASEVTGRDTAPTTGRRHHRPASVKTAVRSHGLRLTSFSLIGGTVFILGAAFQWLLIRAGASADLSYAGQAIFSVELSFTLNRWLTWRTRNLRLLPAAVKWNTQKLALTVPNLLGYAILIRAGLNWLVANVAMTAIFTLVNYVGADVWSFRDSGGGTHGKPRLGWLRGAGRILGPRPGEESPAPLTVGSWSPRVSVVIPCRDNGSTIRETVGSILSQDYFSLSEVILVGSRGDSTWEALEGITDPRLLILEQEPVPGRRDPAAKRDKGIRSASGVVIALVDSDIVMDTDWLSEAVGLLNRQGRKGVVCGGMRSIHDTFWGRFVDRNLLGAKTPRVPAPYKVTKENFGRRHRKPPITANVIFTRDVYEGASFDPSWAYGYEDYEWFWRVAKTGYPVMLSDCLTGRHHHRRNFRELVREYRRAAEGCSRFVRAHPDSPLARKRVRQAIFLPLVTAGIISIAIGAAVTGHVLAVTGAGVAGFGTLVTREFKHSRTAESLTYPVLGGVLGLVFTASLTGGLLRSRRDMRHAAVAPRRAPPLRRIPWPLVAVLAMQAVVSLSLAVSNTAFADEALYVWAGHLQLAHWFGGVSYSTVGHYNFRDYFSGAPQLDPPLLALADSVGGLVAARLLSLCFMLTATVLLYRTASLLYGRSAALASCVVWASAESALRMGAFATYDPLAIMLICAGAWAAVESACRRRRGEWVLLTAVFLALGSAVAYSYAIYIPAVIGIALITAWRLHGRRHAIVSAAWLTGTTFVLLVGILTLLGVWHGLLVTTIDRGHKDYGALLLVVQSAWSYDGLPFLICVVGATLGVAAAKSAPERSLLVLLIATGFLVPAYQVLGAHTGWSLDKHIACGVWLAALCVAAGFAALPLPRMSAAAKAAAAVAAVLFPLITGWVSAFGVQQGWPNASHLVAAIRRVAPDVHGVAFSSLTPQLMEYYTLPYSVHVNRLNWVTPIALNPRVPLDHMINYYLTVLKSEKPQLLVLGFSGALKSPAVAQSIYHTISSGENDARQQFAKITAVDASSSGLFDLAVALEQSGMYRIDSHGPYDSGYGYAHSPGLYILWQRQ